MPGNFVRFVARMGEHIGYALFGRQDDRQLIGPITLEKQALQVLIGIGVDDSRCGTLKCRLS